MITDEELREMAKLKGLSVGNAEKDYLLTLMLSIISRTTKNELVFKGGTCLYKFYRLDRFSEDIDFSAQAIDVDRLSRAIEAGMKLFGVACTLHKKMEPHRSVLSTFKCEGPLYKGTPLSFAYVKMDINLASGVELEPVHQYHSPLYKDVPKFSLLIMAEKEILAEKVRAVLSRTKARDVYDLWFLLKKGVSADSALIAKKLVYYHTPWDLRAFQERIEAARPIWEKELARLLHPIPVFDDVKAGIISNAKTWML